MTEKELIRQCVKHDRIAQQELYEKYAPKMLALCMRYISDREIAQDIMHDGFITVFTKMSDFRHEGSFEGWMRRVFVTTALGYIRKRGSLGNIVSTDSLINIEGGAENIIEKMSADELLRCIERLPIGYKTVLNLYSIEGYSHKEIADMLNINEGTSRSQYLRAKVQLERMIKNKDATR